MAAWRQTAIQQAEHFLTRAEDPSQRGRWQRIHHELSSSPAPWAAATELWMDIAAALLWSGAPQEEVASVLRDAHRLWQAAGDPRQAVMAPWLLHLLQQVSAVSDLAESTRQWIAEHQQEAA
ncbi:hypothetical protein [Streptomyces sp. G-5]|uniref:hypothetical protein n=1 Tax=Streptomyces sp. G-5 TaxID=2977231 RepID=UPI0021D3B9ED|nr:hypothetical protein [Streptomyces sp. G-5]MCU4750304.1 hypothetical protein [Streptomyces sp. G-5]